MTELMTQKKLSSYDRALQSFKLQKRFSLLLDERKQLLLTILRQLNVNKSETKRRDSLPSKELISRNKSRPRSKRSVKSKKGKNRSRKSVKLRTLCSLGL